MAPLFALMSVAAIGISERSHIVKPNGNMGLLHSKYRLSNYDDD